jgi:hypothetical protein
MRLLDRQSLLVKVDITATVMSGDREIMRLLDRRSLLNRQTKKSDIHVQVMPRDKYFEIILELLAILAVSGRVVYSYHNETT